MPPAQWQVYYVRNCQFSTPPKNKFVVIACIDNQPFCFFINTRVNNYLATRPHLAEGQADILLEDNPYLDHDSFINCTEIFEVDPVLLNDYRGDISPKTINNVLWSVARSKTLRARYISLILGK